tara:strand:- start:704 stop:865 length:162 start_codon:yes stop_codon:yes gene_type:complete
VLDDETLLLKIELTELTRSLELEMLELEATLMSELEVSQALHPVNAPVIKVGV